MENPVKMDDNLGYPPWIGNLQIASNRLISGWESIVIYPAQCILPVNIRQSILRLLWKHIDNIQPYLVQPIAVQTVYVGFNFNMLEYVWVNYNDLTVLPHWKSWLVRGIIPFYGLNSD